MPIVLEDIGMFPLNWPDGWERTDRPERNYRFRPPNWDKLCNDVYHEVELLGGLYARLSTNIELRRDGNPYASRPEPDDSGVAIWFLYEDQTKVIACDRWATVRENLHAVAKSINAMRGLERWGAGTILDRAMKGMEQDLLPAPPPWWTVLGVAKDASVDVIRAARVTLAKRYHPDSKVQPDHHKMAEINRAFQEAQDLGVLDTDRRIGHTG